MNVSLCFMDVDIPTEIKGDNFDFKFSLPPEPSKLVLPLGNTSIGSSTVKHSEAHTSFLVAQPLG